jgi:LCP family protein required for cell wall assembly
MIQNSSAPSGPVAILKRLRPGQIILFGIALVLAIAGLITVRGMVRCWRLTPMPGMAPDSCGASSSTSTDATAQPDGTPVANAPATPTATVAAPENPLPPAWDGASRVNILLMAVDYADWSADRKGPSRSDTMIVLTIDPVSKTAGMLSIPRDLWVNIPGNHGYGRINMAYYFGDAEKLPGGGPGLAKRAVEELLGVPIHYYGMVDFETFIDIINELDGLQIYVPKTLILDPLGPGADKIKVAKGYKRLDGQRVLAYVRCRKEECGGDIGRAQRQQEVLMAIRTQVLDPANFPNLISRAPAIYNELQNGIHTDMSLDDAIQLAVLMQNIPEENIKRGVIDDHTMSFPTKVMLGGSMADVLKPSTENIRKLRDEIFTNNGSVGPKALGDELSLMKADAARVRILNATSVNGMAARTQEYLVGQGMNIIEVGNAAQVYPRTRIVVYSPKLYTIRYFATLFKMDSSSQLIIQYDPAAPADVEVFIGDDWANSNPMP